MAEVREPEGWEAEKSTDFELLQEIVRSIRIQGQRPHLYRHRRRRQSQGDDAGLPPAQGVDGSQEEGQSWAVSGDRTAILPEGPERRLAHAGDVLEVVLAGPVVADVEVALLPQAGRAGGTPARRRGLNGAHLVNAGDGEQRERPEEQPE